MQPITKSVISHEQGYHDMAYNEMFAYMFGSGIPNHAKTLQLPTFYASASQSWQRKAIMSSLSIY